VSIVRDGRTILDRISLRIEEGEHVAILGPNGCGKSTLIKTLTREIYPFAGRGSVKIWGQDRWIIRDLRTLLGVVSPAAGEQVLGEPSVMDMAVSGLLGTYGVLFGYEVTPEMLDTAREALAFVQADHLADRRFETLSSGETRRVLIARALVSQPKGLVLDEPTTSLDLKASHHFRVTMRRIAQAGTSLVLVTHHLDEIVPEIDRVIMLSDGRVLADGPTQEVMTAANLSRLFDADLRLHREPFFRAEVCND
jgi:iron complex transport system ATP-binding protein